MLQKLLPKHAWPSWCSFVYVCLHKLLGKKLILIFCKKIFHFHRKLSPTLFICSIRLLSSDVITALITFNMFNDTHSGKGLKLSTWSGKVETHLLFICIFLRKRRGNFPYFSDLRFLGEILREREGSTMDSVISNGEKLACE